MRLTILHTNDIHGRQERIARLATLVDDAKARADHQVLYLDAGDVEDSTNLLSSATRGAAMHRLLAQAGCDAATVGNAAWLRYGTDVLAEHARVSPHPQLLANFTPVTGPVPSTLLGDVGVFGLTAPMRGWFPEVDFRFEPLDELESARRASRDLRARGARFVVLVSHLGLETPSEPWDDRRLAAELQDEVDVIVGGHSHDLLPTGERFGRVLIVQAGCFGEHLGRIDVDRGSVSASLVEVTDEVPAHPAVEDEIARLELEVAELLAETIGEVTEPLDAAWVAEVLRVRMRAEVGLFPEGLTDGVLPPGPVTRGALWQASPSANNPGAADLTGEQLQDLLRRASDPAFVAETPRPLRGRPRGRLHVAGLDPDAIDDGRRYRVAASDWVLDPYGGYTRKEWRLGISYDFPVTIREAVEVHLRGD